MEDPKVLFSDTTARRAQLMAATEQYKASISNNVDAIKVDANEAGKTIAIVAGFSLAVYLVVNAVLPKSEAYRYAEKYGEPDNETIDLADHETPAANGKRTKQPKRSSALSGLLGGIVTSALTAIVRQELANFVERTRQNNSINSTASPTSGNQYPKAAQTDPA